MCSRRGTKSTFNGAHALTAGGDRLLRLWDLADGACIRTFAGHTDTVETVMSRHGSVPHPDLDDLIAADGEARRMAAELLRG